MLHLDTVVVHPRESERHVHENEVPALGILHRHPGPYADMLLVTRRDRAKHSLTRHGITKFNIARNIISTGCCRDLQPDGWNIPRHPGGLHQLDDISGVHPLHNGWKHADGNGGDRLFSSCQRGGERDDKGDCLQGWLD